MASKVKRSGVRAYQRSCAAIATRTIHASPVATDAHTKRRNNTVAVVCHDVSDAAMCSAISRASELRSSGLMAGGYAADRAEATGYKVRTGGRC